MAYATMAGASLLLMPALLPEMRHLRDRTDYGVLDGADGTDVSTGWIGPAGVDLPSIDLSHFDFGSFDFNAFDALDSAMSAIDAAVDSAGGGDSGGGFGDSGSSDSGAGSGES
jgi:hypothetical protein